VRRAGIGRTEIRYINSHDIQFENMMHRSRGPRATVLDGGRRERDAVDVRVALPSGSRGRSRGGHEKASRGDRWPHGREHRGGGPGARLGGGLRRTVRGRLTLAVPVADLTLGGFSACV
jgi:hypothetical protein